MVAEAVALLYFSAIAYLAIRRVRSGLQIWKDAAAACGLEVVEAVQGVNPHLRARSGDMEVRIRRSGESGRVLVSVKASGPPDLPKVRLRLRGQVQFTRAIEVGDKPFDGRFAVDGPAPLVSALLNGETRRLLSAIEGRLDLSAGELRVNVPDANLSTVLRPLLDLRQRLAEPIDVPRRLADNARQDPVPGVRRQNLLVLIRELRSDPATAEALRAARTDPSPDVRLAAARELGAEGRALLLDLAEKLEDDAVSADAVRALGKALPFEKAAAILDLALSRSRRRLRTARACLKSIGRSQDAAAVGLLAGVMAREQGKLAFAAAQALGLTGSPAAEPPLIQALRSGDAQLRIAAATALGRAGSTAAVLPLKEAFEGHRLDAELRQAARQAIAEIQSRVHGASPGQLSLAGSDAGQLSLAAEAGELSLADDPAGRLSLGEEEG